VADDVIVGGVTYVTDDIGGTGRQAQVVKPAFGDDGVATMVSTTNPIPVAVTTSSGNTAPVTGALTAVAAATIAGTANTTGSVVMDVSAAGNASFHLLATAFVGTVTFEQSFDPAGTAGTWAPVPCIPEDALTPPAATLAISTAVAYIRQFTQGMFGPARFRVRCSAFTSGSLTVYMKNGPGWVETQPALAPSSAVIGAVMPAGGTTFTGPTAITLTANTALTIAAADTTGARKGVVITNRHASGNVLVTFNAAATTANDLYIVPPTGTLEVPQGFVNALISVISTVAAPIRYATAS
jgi:hypothetical protein